ncbi:MAG: hypothetical protein HGB17_11155 [Syntrophobacteraceae bacterium]|nr:hypothetical protein [Syntrophobacteraceae bacterium]
MAVRWKRATRALRIQEQPFGQRLVRMLEDTGTWRFATVDDPLEAAAFILFIGMLKELDKESPPESREGLTAP